jgi:vacuole morphology and inheritance protein 14
MDPNIQKALTDKLYDKRKSGALEYVIPMWTWWKAAGVLSRSRLLTCDRLEGLIRECLQASDHDRIAKIVNQLCHDYAYQVHQPHARNGGLIGLAAASIALGPVCSPLASYETER